MPPRPYSIGTGRDIRRRAARLLRRHEPARAKHRAGLVRIAVRGPGQSPVQHEDLPELPDHHVIGRQIAVDDVVRVRERHRVADPLEHPEAVAHHGMAAEVLAQRHTSDAFHHVEQPPVGQPSHVVDRDDAGVFETGQNARLALEPAFQARARDRVGHLHRDLAAEHLVARQVDGPHASAAHFIDDDVAIRHKLRPGRDGLEASDGGVGQERHSTSTPKISRASRRNSSCEPVSPSRAASACWRKLRRTWAR